MARAENSARRLRVVAALSVFVVSCCHHWQSVSAANLCPSRLDDRDLTPLGFLIGTCSIKERLVPYTDLIIGSLLTVNGTKSVRPVIDELRPHLKALTEGDFCPTLKAGTDEKLWKALAPKEFDPDKFYNELLCHRRYIKSFVEEEPIPKELSAFSHESLKDLRWILDNAGRLERAVNVEYRALHNRRRRRRHMSNHT